MDLQEFDIVVTSVTFFLSFPVLQGDDGEHCPGQSQPQQEGLQHSFVKEHFQAQYKYVCVCDEWQAHRWVDIMLGKVNVK